MQAINDYVIVDKIKEAVEQLPVEYEIILVEDGSPDKSWDVIQFEAHNFLIMC